MKYAVSAVLLSSLLLAGCASKLETPNIQSKEIAANSYQPIPARLMDRVESVGNLYPFEVKDILLSSSKQNAGKPQIDLIVKNTGSETLPLQYRVVWKDVKANETWKKEPWKAELVRAGEERVITFLAPFDETTDFRVGVSRQRSVVSD